MKIYSEVFLRGDLEAILWAIAVASARVSNSPHDAAHRRGFAQAILAMAVAIHVDPQLIAQMMRDARANTLEDVR